MSRLIENKKIRLNYEILETFEAGMELFGFEVKSLRAKNGSLKGSHVTVRGGEAYLIGMHIAPYQSANTPESYDPERHRRLLLTRKEIDELEDYESKRGLTIVPLSVYSDKRKLKVRLGVARGKKKFDKREVLKARDAKRHIDREMKNR